MTFTHQPKIIHIVQDITTLNVCAIFHQTNCNTIFPHGLSKTIFKAFPWADCYSIRKKNPNGHSNIARDEDQSIPGTCEKRKRPFLRTNTTHPQNPQYVINVFGQLNPGKPGKYNRSPQCKHKDTKEQRETWFRSALLSIVDFLNDDSANIHSIAIPAKIGCGLAGGDAKVYQQIILNEFVPKLKLVKEVYLVSYQE